VEAKPAQRQPFGITVPRGSQTVTLMIDDTKLAPEHFMVAFMPDYDNTYFIQDLSVKKEKKEEDKEDKVDPSGLNPGDSTGTWLSVPANVISNDLQFNLHEDENFAH
jgi:hypothetical protein